MRLQPAMSATTLAAVKAAPSWNDLALFAVVARVGTLAAARAETGTSTATLSRRMTALEETLGRRLFRHGAEGYALTADGRALRDRTAPMEHAALAVADWQAAGDAIPRVRISAGTWTSTALARAISAFWAPDADWVPEFVHCDRDLDIARREVDIGIRNRRPDQPWLAGRRTRTVRYAAYGRDGASGWIGATEDAAQTPSSRWLLRSHGDAVVTTANDPRIALALAEAGLGRVVLPTFLGDATDLPRQGDEIAALAHEEWLITHHEARHAPPIRAALDALAAHLTTERGTDAGP